METKVRTVALNALFLAPGESGGPETYLRELASALADEFPELRIVVFTTRPGATALAANGFADRMELVALPAREHSRVRRQVAEQMLLPVMARRAGADVLHNLASTGPAWTPGLAAVATLHDVTFFRLPTFGRVTTWGMRRVMSSAARDADALIAVSAAARDDICSELGLDADAFSVVPHGIEHVSRQPSPRVSGVRDRLRLDGRRVVLCVAAIRPHKNQTLLVRATAHLPDDVTVVMVGHQEPYVEPLRELALQLDVEDRIRLPGYLAGEELDELWSIADCAAFPTLAEGFGLPVLEAMMRGVPVACSDIAVLREVGGDVPRYFDPHDHREAATAIRVALEDGGSRGPERAAGFSWSVAARETMETYERALAINRA